MESLDLGVDVVGRGAVSPLDLLVASRYARAVDDGLIGAPELAAELRVDPKRLRHAIRRHRLVPDHQKGKHYRLDAGDVARIRSHPAVRRLPRR